MTFTFENPLWTAFVREREAMRSLVSTCKALGGRVHLVKNVDATGEEVEEMYRDRLADLALAERARVGATARVSNQSHGFGCSLASSHRDEERSGVDPGRPGVDRHEMRSASGCSQSVWA